MREKMSKGEEEEDPLVTLRDLKQRSPETEREGDEEKKRESERGPNRKLGV